VAPNAADLAARVDERVRASAAQVLVVLGDARSRALLLDVLPERSARIASEVENSGGASPLDLPDTIARAVDLFHEEGRRMALARYREAAGRADGLSATGLGAVVAAARAQAIDTLFVDPALVTEARILAGDGAAELALDDQEAAALGAVDPTAVAAVPALIRAAACSDAELIVLDDPNVVEGRDQLDDAPPAEERTAGSDTGLPGDGVESSAPGVLAAGLLTDGVGAVLRFPVARAG
jgi:hypothetical protein